MFTRAAQSLAHSGRLAKQNSSTAACRWGGKFLSPASSALGTTLSVENSRVISTEVAPSGTLKGSAPSGGAESSGADMSATCRRRDEM